MSPQRWVHTDELKGAEVADGVTMRHVAAPWITGTTGLWLGVVDLQPGARTTMKAINEEGIHFTLEGEGTEIVGDDSIATRAGSCISIPPQVPHCVINSGTGVLRVLSVVTPPLAPPQS